jgi:Cu2+-containing amine oxidase
VPGSICDRSGEVAKTGPVAVEVHDGQVRWMNAQNVIRRGQGVSVWAVLDGANYRYIMLYDFRDDGTVGFRIGATAHNLNSSDSDTTTHLHMGWWRLHVALGDATRTRVSTVALKTGTMPEKTAVAPVLTETALKWVPEEFTRLRVESTVEKNKHTPAHFIGYDLVPTRMGSGRYTGVGEQFTQNDFWVTRAKGGEVRPRDLPAYTDGEKFDGAITLWHQTPVLHTARDEDFGPVGTNAGQGVAITTWAGCDLKPRNFFPSTPLYP